MKSKRYIVCLLAVLTLIGCGTKKKVSRPVADSQPDVPQWRTCLIQGARTTISANGSQYAAAVTMQTVRDSMLVISVMPMLGVEIIRFEATPFEMTGINKLEGTYATTTYAEVNRRLVPTVNWDVLQQLCSAELPTGNERARLVYSLGDQTIEMTVDYPVRQLDVPVRVTHQDTKRYKKIDISKWL